MSSVDLLSGPLEAALRSSDVLQLDSQLSLSITLPVDALYETVLAYQCRLCQHLSSLLDEMTAHIQTQHCQSESSGVAAESPGVAAESPGVAAESPGVVTESPGVVTESPGVVTESPSAAAEYVSLNTPVESCPVDSLGQRASCDSVRADSARGENGNAALVEDVSGTCWLQSSTVVDVYKASGSVKSGSGATETSERRMFLCSECGLACDTLDTCKQHMKKQHLPSKKRSSSVEPVGADAAIQSVLAEGAKRGRHPPPWLADVRRFRCRRGCCLLSFSTHERRDVHEQCHDRDGGRLFWCRRCCTPPVDGVSWTRMLTHLWRAHRVDLDLQRCDSCEFRCSKLANLRTHRRQQHPSRRAGRYACAHCEQSFCRLPQLLDHRLVHEQEAPRLPPPRWCGPRLCTPCGRVFSSSWALRCHQRTRHDRLRVHGCTICSHTSATAHLLRLHMRGHSGHAPHVCQQPGCQFRTRDPSSFRKHQMRHTGVRPYKCSLCQYSCIQSAAYKRHMQRYHDGAGLYRCQSCPYTSVNPVSLSLHAVSHENGAPLVSPARSAALPLAIAPPPVVNRGRWHNFQIVPDGTGAEDRGGVSIPAGEESRLSELLLQSPVSTVANRS